MLTDRPAHRIECIRKSRTSKSSDIYLFEKSPVEDKAVFRHDEDIRLGRRIYWIGKLIEFEQGHRKFFLQESSKKYAKLFSVTGVKGSTHTPDTGEEKGALKKQVQAHSIQIDTSL